MVTIEQKLLLFSKLLNQSMNHEFVEKMEQLDREYKEKVKKNKEAVDKEAGLMLKEAEKKGEAEHMEHMSRVRMNMKKETMLVKERYFTLFLDELKKELRQFAKTDAYNEYMQRLIEELKDRKDDAREVVIYMTHGDVDKFSEKIKDELRKARSGYEQISVKTANDSILGGFMAEYPDKNVRINMTMESVIEDNNQYIMQHLFDALEAGE